MQISEEKIRQIGEEALRHLGPQANSLMLKKVVSEVINRLLADDQHDGRAKQ